MAGAGHAGHALSHSVQLIHMNEEEDDELMCVCVCVKIVGWLQRGDTSMGDGG